MSSVSIINWSNQASVYKSLQSLQYKLACESINWSANFSICHINIVSLNKNLEKFETFLSQQPKNLDIIC